MHKYVSLTKALFKSGFQITDGRSKKGFKIFLYILLAVCFIPLLATVYFAVDALLPFYARIDQTASILGTTLFLTCFIIFIFSLFLIPSVFYFSADLDTLLALPLKSTHIIGAKFTICVMYEYLFALFILLPTYAAYWNFGGMPITFIPFAILTVLIIPIFPLVLSTFFTILLMRFVPFFNNRDRFNLISSIILVVLGLSLSFFMNAQGTQDEAAMLESLLAGGNSLLDLFMKCFPMIPYLAKAIVEGSVIDLLIALGIHLIAIIVLLTLGKLLYFKGAIGSGETNASHKALSENKLKRTSHLQNKKWTYIKKDFKVLFRTPAYFTNCLLMVVLFPLMMILMLFFSQSEGLQELNLTYLLRMVEQSDYFVAYVIFISLAMGFLFGSLNQISATAISREGQQYTVMKYIPMSYRDQIHAKLTLGIIAGIVANVLMALVCAWILPFTWYYYVLYCVCAMITTVLANSYGIMLDLAKPKLVWEQESAAVKQNIGTFAAIMISMALCIVIIVGCFLIPEKWLFIAAFGGFGVSLLLAVLCYVLAGKYAERAMRNM